MLSLNLHTLRTAAAVVLCGLLLAPVRALADDAPDEAGDADKDELVVPAGQDELLGQMLGLGAALPGQCRFVSGVADGAKLESTYGCPQGEVVLALVHSNQASETATQTERFAITVESGSLPNGLVDAIAALIHAHESKFEWSWRSTVAPAPEAR